MKLSRGFSSALIALFTLAVLVSCGSTDVVATKAPQSFQALLDASKGRLSWSAEDSSWVLSSPGGDQVYFSSDFSRNSGSASMADMDKPDVEFSFDAAPFLAAGLDLTKLPKAEGITYELEEGRFMLHFELGSEKFPPEAAASMAATLGSIVRLERARLGYHDKLDHYGLKLGNGNMLEWARDLKKNDKDLVFVLNPEPFQAAGIDPSKIQGWTLAKVETKDDQGKVIFVDKLLKAYNLD